MSIRWMVVAVMLSPALTVRVGAQLRADPGTVIDGRVAVRVYVTLSDDETSYAPIGGVHLRFFRTTSDTAVLVRTDAAGTATAMLLPGEYRLLSSSPVDWKGARYSWSQLVQVRPGIPTIELAANTAVKTELSPEAISADAASAGTAAGARSSDGDVELVKKDPSMATLLSFFVPGTGQLYSNDYVKGAGLLAVSVAGAAVAAKQLSCAAASDCKSTTGGLALGAAGMVAFFGSWIYGITDAGNAARRFNTLHGLASAAVRPIVEPAGDGRAHVGWSLAFGH